MVRTFIAVDISEEQRAVIGQTVSTLKHTRSGVRWVRPENLHLTLKFLGSIDETSIDKISQVLKELSAGYAPFKMELKTIGAFSSLKRPDVIWIGVKKSLELETLAADIEQKLSVIGFKKEDRPYSPHLTIARVKNLKGYDEIYEKLKALSDKDFGACEVTEVSLMKSDLTPDGAQYTHLKSFRLKQASH
ncbi:RNA 2',3'-cyclic phosphodiesterase [Candidatus Magnetominusculus xianensis]|uniref:RNA 2',3'-cyclic phosphodiesterase n=1 Tax=Candidatus Magnetominusculus xianensis TaxID=1748249 RepID=A0ABR5SKS1_9BACT|nr:RNA 2',3'-cyclic phosphodiesterase [Candidatus Magnetominusculus xianensis]KWT90933.1 2'-5'-RNA ligase [Candidatus Magnetominusculus xianensis]MBF0403089.1 RNA 2',3'-cyclic phosphodiesterase [Nitrospirota bacterium]